MQQAKWNNIWKSSKFFDIWDKLFLFLVKSVVKNFYADLGLIGWHLRMMIIRSESSIISQIKDTYGFDGRTSVSDVCPCPCPRFSDITVSELVSVSEAMTLPGFMSESEVRKILYPCPNLSLKLIFLTGLSPCPSPRLNSCPKLYSW